MSTEKIETPSLKYGSLYDNISQIYNIKKPISRIIYIAKLKESNIKDEKVARETILGGIRDEVKKNLKKFEEPFNIMIFYIGTVYALVGIEVRIL